jgi:hypothetical protein
MGVAEVGMGVVVESALVPRSGSGSELLLSARCSQTPTTITRITTATTHPPRLTIHLITRLGAVGIPITVTITLADERAHDDLAWFDWLRGRPKMS